MDAVIQFGEIFFHFMNRAFQFEVTIPFVGQRTQVTFAVGGGRDGKVV